MRVLVTGGAGFIGSHLVERLIEQGDQVTVIDDFTAGLLDNLESVKNSVDIVKWSILDLGLVTHLVSKTDVIFHLATQCLVKGLEDPKIMHEVNDIGTFNICLAAREYKVKIVYIGSSEEYGNQQDFPIKETAPLRPISIYGITKAIGEEYVRFFHKIYDVPAVIIRPFNTYGPRHREDDYAAVITNFIKRTDYNKQPIIYGDGLQTREFTYISDIVDGIVLLSKLQGAEVVNLGSGMEISILDLAELVQKIWNPERPVMRPVFRPPRPHDIKRFCADISLANKYGYKPKVSLSDGLKSYIAGYRKREKQHAENRFH